MLAPFFTWLQNHEALVSALVVGSLCLTVGGILLTPWLVVRIPADYFVGDKPHAWGWTSRHPAIRVALIVSKNIAGVFLFLLGILLSLPLVPGPGFITMLIGFLLIDIPGKRRLEQWIVSRSWVFAVLNKLRARAGRSPLLLPEPAESKDGPSKTEQP